jgi:predicted nucleic acid-binding protein
MYLLDTNVVSELRKARSGRMDENVLRWSGTVSPGELFLSAISVLELEIGIRQMERRDEKQGEALRSWFREAVLPTFENRILAVDVRVAQCCAGFNFPDPRPDRDGLIGATASVHGFVLVTRNIRDFAGMGIALLDPWSALP